MLKTAKQIVSPIRLMMPLPSSSPTAQAHSAQLRLLDIAGKVIFEQQIGAGTSTVNINTARLSNGTYFYQVIDNGVNLGTQKLVVLH